MFIKQYNLVLSTFPMLTIIVVCQNCTSPSYKYSCKNSTVNTLFTCKLVLYRNCRFEINASVNGILSANKSDIAFVKTHSHDYNCIASLTNLCVANVSVNLNKATRSWTLPSRPPPFSRWLNSGWLHQPTATPRVIEIPLARLYDALWRMWGGERWAAPFRNGRLPYATLCACPSSVFFPLQYVCTVCFAVAYESTILAEERKRVKKAQLILSLIFKVMTG